MLLRHSSNAFVFYNGRPEKIIPIDNGGDFKGIFDETLELANVTHLAGGALL